MSEWDVNSISLTSNFDTELSTESFNVLKNGGTSSSKSSSSSSTSETNVFLTNVRVYVAGVLIPVSGFSVNSSFGTIPTASIILPANPKLFGIGFHDRVPVQIFMQESMVGSSEFILMFEGFIASKSYLSVSTQREICLTLLSYADVFNDMKYKILTDLASWAEASAHEGSETGKIVVEQYPNMFFNYGLGSTANNKKAITMPTEYLANIIRLVEENCSDRNKDPGFYHHNTKASEFYGSLCKQLHMDQRFAWLPYFDYPKNDKSAANMYGESSESNSGDNEKATMFPMLYGLKIKESIDILQKKATQCSNEQTMMELLQFLIKEMEYEFMVFTSPSYYSGIDNNFGDEMEGLNLKYSPNAGNSRMVHFVLKPLFNDAFPPTCNILFRSQIQEIRIQEQCVRVPTRIEVCGLSPKYLGVTTNTALGQFADIKYYPSPAFSHEDPNNTEHPGQDDEATEVEKYTGPWIARSNAPEWLTYLSPTWTGEDAMGYHERFMRRQLLFKQYMDKNMSVTMAFCPYVTPGFPAVVFDSYDSNLAFAGYVTAVSHNVSLASTTTTVSLSYVRLLETAIANRIPSPIDAINEISASEKYLTDIYSVMLGKDISAVSFQNALSKWGGQGGTASTSDPQNNIYEAYKIQRRNIMTLKEYCSFMGLSAMEGELGDGEQAVVQITGTFISSRCKLNVYDTVPLEEVYLTSAKQKKAAEEAAKKKAEEEAKKKNAEKVAAEQKDKGGGTSSDNKDSSSNSSSAGTTVSPEASKDKGAADAANAQKSKGATSKDSATNSNSTSESEEEKKKKAAQKKRSVLTSQSVDLITVLKAISDEEFSNHIY